jgi:hypothetical protein
MAAKKEKHVPPDGQIRRSQIVTTFGPGALVDLTERSGIVAGLEHWGDPEKAGSGFREVDEPRLLARLAGQGIRKLYTPPTLPRNEEGAAGIVVWEFPQWFLLQPDAPEERWDHELGLRSRQLLHRHAFRGMMYGKRKAVPIRFVQACPYGHVSDIDWGRFVHKGGSGCHGELWMDERGTTGDFADIFVRCRECKKTRSLAEAIPRRPNDPDDMPLGACEGCEPWLGPDRWRGRPQGCPPAAEAPQKKVGNRLLVRSATNAYFPELVTVISIPEQCSAIDEAVGSVWDAALSQVEALEELKAARRWNRDVDKALNGHDDVTVLAAIHRRRAAPPVAAPRSFKGPEMVKLLSDDLGIDLPESDFFATEIALPERRPEVLRAVRRVLAVHRLREVVATLGFTRLEPPVRDAEGSLDLGVRRARLAKEATWLPAVENRGEGVFVAFEPELIHNWATSHAVEPRQLQLEAGVKAWRASRPGAPLRFPGVEYVMLHSLSHLLITAVSLECGYAASSIRERIYAGPEGFGILLYTSTPDAEGTLGGLAAVARKLEHHITAALAYGALCSNDPVCAQHEPHSAVEERFFHGAACHGCVLVAEPSCEWQNEFLDRALVVPTVQDAGAAFFAGARSHRAGGAR